MQLEEKISLIKDKLKNDPLFKLISNTEYEAQLFDESYLIELKEKEVYGTKKVAEWFNESDSQVRYYLKNFKEYLAEEGVVTSDNAIRLGFLAVLKLKMIFLLKDQHKTSGLQAMIEGHVKVLPHPHTNVPSPNDLEKLKELKELVDSITLSGLFIPGSNKVKVNEEGLRQFFAGMLPSPEEKKLEQVKRARVDLTNKIEIENVRLEYVQNKLDDIDRYIKTLKLKDSSKKKQSFFSKLLKPNSDDSLEVLEILKDNATADQEHYKKSKKTISTVIASHQKELEALDKEIKELQLQLSQSSELIVAASSEEDSNKTLILEGKKE